MNYKRLKEKLKATEKSNKYLKDCNKDNRKQVIRLKEENNDLYDKLLKWLEININRSEQISLFIDTLDYIWANTTDELTTKIVENAIEKHSINILIANRKNQDE